MGGGDYHYTYGAGHGSLSITDGGTVSVTAQTYVGWTEGSTGTVTVDGPGSAWTNNGRL